MPAKLKNSTDHANGLPESSVSGRRSRGISSGSSGNRSWKLILLIVIGLACIVSAMLFFKLGYRFLFSQNRRFSLRRIELDSTGYWQNRTGELAQAIGLKLNYDNLFELDTADLRKKLEAIPNIRQGAVRIVPPDTIRLELVERIPRARLFRPGSDWVADADGVALLRSQTMDFAGRLPVIIGFHNTSVRQGQVMPETFEAMKLIITVLRNFPDLTVIAINIQKKDQLLFTACYLTSKENFTVLLPAKSTDMNVKLSALQAAIQETRHRGERATLYDLRFKDQVVAR